MMNPLYSICVTNFNTKNTVRLSLESILNQIDERFEIIIVDNHSNDGSLEILKEYQNQKRIKLIGRHCSRGLGRKIAVEDSAGKYIISQVDMDDVLEPKLNELLKIYHAYFEGFMLLVSGVPGMMIAPKKLIERVGGYRDLNYLEDIDLYSRVSQLGRFRFLKSFKIVAYSINSKKIRSRILRFLKNKYFTFRESFRIGYGLTFLRKSLHRRLILAKHPLFILGDFTFAFWGFVTHHFYRCYPNNSINVFAVDHYEVKL